MMVQTGYGAVLEQDASAQALDAQCFYNVCVYPSSEMKSDHITVNPLVFLFMLLGTFLFTSLVFWVYDRLVTHWHTIVKTKAIQSSTVVSELFPEKVRECLYNKDATTAGATKKNEKSILRCNSISSIDDDSYVVNGDMPIADLYPECTVHFADIVGFTSRSSSRTPTQVFKLLETLYATFDKHAPCCKGKFQL